RRRDGRGRDRDRPALLADQLGFQVVRAALRAAVSAFPRGVTPRTCFGYIVSHAETPRRKARHARRPAAYLTRPQGKSARRPAREEARGVAAARLREQREALPGSLRPRRLHRLGALARRLEALRRQRARA